MLSRSINCPVGSSAVALQITSLGPFPVGSVIKSVSLWCGDAFGPYTTQPSALMIYLGLFSSQPRTLATTALGAAAFDGADNLIGRSATPVGGPFLYWNVPVAAYFDPTVGLAEPFFLPLGIPLVIPVFRKVSGRPYLGVGLRTYGADGWPGSCGCSVESDVVE